MSDYRLTEAGIKAMDRMQDVYFAELRKIREEIGDDEYLEGTCIIDDSDHIKTLDDEVDYLILCYEADVLNVLGDWSRHCGLDDKTGGPGTWTHREIFKRIAERGLLEVV